MVRVLSLVGGLRGCYLAEGARTLGAGGFGTEKFEVYDYTPKNKRQTDEEY